MSKRSTKNVLPPSGRSRTSKSRSMMSSSLSRQSSSAPAAVSRSRRAHVSYSSSTVSGRASLKVTTTVPFCEIGNDTHNNGLLLQGAGTAAAFTASVCDLTPYDITQAVSNGSSISVAAGTWISPHVPLLALAFDRYAVSSVTWHYEPQATATVSDRLVFAWTDDPSHPFLSAQGAAAASATPTQLDLLVTKDSVAFMPWKDWSLTVPVARDARFMYDMAGATVQGQFERFFSFGSCSCVGSAGPSAIIYGVLYVSIVVDFFDPVPIVTSVKTLVTELHRNRRLHGRGRVASVPLLSVGEAFGTPAPQPPSSSGPPAQGALRPLEEEKKLRLTWPCRESPGTFCSKQKCLGDDDDDYVGVTPLSTPLTGIRASELGAQLRTLPAAPSSSSSTPLPARK